MPLEQQWFLQRQWKCNAQRELEQRIPDESRGFLQQRRKNWGYGLMIVSSRTGYVCLGFWKVAVLRESWKVDRYIQYTIRTYIYMYIWTVHKYTHSLNPTCHVAGSVFLSPKKNTSSNPKQTFEVWHNSPKRASRLMKDRQISRDSLLTVLTSFTSPPSTEVHRVNKSWKALRSPHDFSV